jgi:hypothetical protein
MGAGSPGLAKTDTYMRRCHRRRVRGRAADRRAGRMPIDWTRRLAAGGKRSEIVFCSPFPCEVRPLKLGVTKAAVARDSGCYFPVDQVFENAQQSH